MRKIYPYIIIIALFMVGCDFGSSSPKTEEEAMPSRTFVAAEGYTVRELAGELVEIGEIGFADFFEDKVYVTDQSNGEVVHVLQGNGDYDRAIHLEGKTIGEPGPLIVQDLIYLVDNKEQNIEIFTRNGTHKKTIHVQYPENFGMPYSLILDMEILDEWLYFSDQGGKDGIARVHISGDREVEPLIFPWNGNIAVHEGKLYLSCSMDVGNPNQESGADQNEIVATASDGSISEWTDPMKPVTLFSFSDGYMPCDFLLDESGFLIVSAAWNVVDRYEKTGTYIDTPANLNRNQNISARFGQIIRTGESRYMLVLYRDHEIVQFVKNGE